MPDVSVGDGALAAGKEVAVPSFISGSGGSAAPSGDDCSVSGRAVPP
jgi:hypothetical protein